MSCAPAKGNPRRCGVHYLLPLYPDGRCVHGRPSPRVEVKPAPYPLASLLRVERLRDNGAVLDVEPDPFPRDRGGDPDDERISIALAPFVLVDERQRARLWQVVRRLVEAGDARAARLGGWQRVCRGCGQPLLPENAWMTDGCPCNSPRGVNDALEV